MKNLHYGQCLIGLALAVIVLIAFGVSVGTLGLLGVTLLCPLMMFVMMRMMMGNNKASSGSVDNDQPVGQHR